MKWDSRENADAAGISNRHAKDGGAFASNAEAKMRKNRKESYYTPSNEYGEALHGLIGLKNSILVTLVPVVAITGRVQVLRLRATRAWRSAQDDGAFEGFDRASGGL